MTIIGTIAGFIGGLICGLGIAHGKISKLGYSKISDIPKSDV